MSSCTPHGIGTPVLVTGGTGFVGANVVRALLADGCRVRVLARPGSDRTALTGCPVEEVRGDLLDEDSLRRAAAGCSVVFHVAADYRLWVPDPTSLYRTNVNGTRNVLEACAAARVERVVYTSSVGTLGIPKSGESGTETTAVSLRDMVGPYKRSKFLAERVAEDYAARGLPVVIVNPSNPIGPWDVKPTPTGQMVVDFINLALGERRAKSAMNYLVSPGGRAASRSSATARSARSAPSTTKRAGRRTGARVSS